MCIWQPTAQFALEQITLAWELQERIGAIPARSSVNLLRLGTAQAR